MTTPGLMSASCSRRKSGVVCAGSAWMISSAPASASATTVVADSVGGSVTSLRYLLLTCASLIDAACTGSRQYITTSFPFFAAT